MDEINSKLVQTRIPPATERAARTEAEKEGVSLATWIRRLIARAVGYDGRGKKLRKI